MSYYTDLSFYNYHHHSQFELNIGWLQKDQPFAIGEVQKEFLEKLKVYKEHKMFQTKGIHRCEFCEDNATSSNEFRVISKNGKFYACPMLVIHYIEFHNYLPPQEFIDAVMEGPAPGSEEYKSMLAVMASHWELRQPEPDDVDYHEQIQNTMVDRLSSEIDAKIFKEILEQNPVFSKFIQGYSKVMPSVYGLNKGEEEKNEKS